jgi:hypothetical protein
MERLYETREEKAFEERLAEARATDKDFETLHAAEIRRLMNNSWDEAPVSKEQAIAIIKNRIADIGE